MNCPKCGKEINENQKFCTNCGNVLSKPQILNNKQKVYSIAGVPVVLFLICCIVVGYPHYKNFTQNVNSETLNCENYQNYSLQDEKSSSGYLQCTLDEKIVPLNNKYKIKEQEKYWENISFIIEHVFENKIKYENKQPQLIGKYNTMDSIYIACYKEYILYKLGNIALGLSEDIGPDYMYGNGNWENYLEDTKSSNSDFGKLSNKGQVILAKKIQNQTEYFSDKFKNDYLKKIYIAELMGIEHNATSEKAKKILQDVIEKNKVIFESEVLLEKSDKYDSAIYSREQMIKGYEFAEQIKSAVKNKDLNFIADNINYPITINNNDENIYISDKNQLVNYNIEEFFTKDFIENVCNDDLFVNSQGFMLGNGEIWFSFFDNVEAPKIYRINIINYNN